ncbi:MAG: hypothetical protein Q9162_005430 [Coniocarpon cinnabarinum]
MGKCSCHSNPKEPITDAERAPQDIAEAHEDERERAKEWRRLRATKGALPQDFKSEAAARGVKEAQREAASASNIKSECCGASSSPLTKRRKIVPVQQWQERSTDSPLPGKDGDNCRCPPGECSCVGCSDHPTNEATIKMVNEVLNYQGQMLEKKPGFKKESGNKTTKNKGPDRKKSSSVAEQSKGIGKRENLESDSQVQTPPAEKNEPQSTPPVQLIIPDRGRNLAATPVSGVYNEENSATRLSSDVDATPNVNCNLSGVSQGSVVWDSSLPESVLKFWDNA